MENINIEKLAPVISEVVGSGSSFRLNPTGKSMYPTIVENEDSVLLVKADTLKKYDIVLYRRKNGQFVLHRIVRISHGKFTMCGDSQFVLERNVTASDILAKVSGIFKGTSLIFTDGKEYVVNVKKMYKKKLPMILAMRLKNAFIKLKKIIKK